MKTIKIAAFMLAATTALSAQDLKMNEVPAKLQSTFIQEFPKATDREWEKDGLNYKVEFDLGKMEHEVWYDINGKVLKTEMEVPKSELPKNLADKVRSMYEGYKIDEVKIIEMDSKKNYEIEVEKWLVWDKTVIMDTNGNVIDKD